MTAVLSLVALAALAATTYAIWDLVGVGTCASGGPYVSSRECPDGTGLTSVLLFVGASTYILAVVVAAQRSMGAGAFWFGLLFTVLGATFVLGAATHHANAQAGDSDMVGWLLGALFLAMGILPLIGGIIMMVNDRKDDKNDDEPVLFTGPYVVGSIIVQAPAVPPTPGERR